MISTDQIKKIEKRRESRASCEEVQNFDRLVDDSRKLFNPDISTLQRQVAKGTKLEKRRVSDIGISMNNDYASGILSETITAGDEWFEMADANKVQADADMFDDMTGKMFDAINHSNFYSEMHRDQRNAGSDGTACMYVDRHSKKLIFNHAPYGSFWFTQDYRGKPDTVWVEKKTTAGALVAEYGESNVSNKCKVAAEKNPDEEVCIIYYCAPRAKRDATKIDTLNKAYEHIIYEKGENHLLEESGVDAQKYMVYRVKRILNETLGRGPCIDTLCTMNVVERASKDLQKSMRLSSVPIYAVGASMGQKGFRMIHNDDASVMVYDDTGIAHPPQTMNPSVNIDFALKFIESQVMGMRSLFFLDYFNPVMDKKNITAYQTREIVSKSQQMVGQITEPFCEERLDPLLRWVMILLGEAGEFKDYGSWVEVQAKLAGRVTIRHKSRLANAQKRLRLLSIVEFMEMQAMMAQGIPDPVMQYEFMSMLDVMEVPQELIEGTNAPQKLLRDKDEAKAMAEQFAQSLAKQAEMDNMVKGADAASKGGTAPEQGSPTSMMMGQG